MERQGIQLRGGLLPHYGVADFLRASDTFPDAPEMPDSADAQAHNPAANTAGAGDSLYLRLLEEIRLAHDSVRRPHGDADRPLRPDLRDLHTV